MLPYHPTKGVHLEVSFGLEGSKVLKGLKGFQGSKVLKGSKVSRFQGLKVPEGSKIWSFEGFEGLEHFPFKLPSFWKVI